MKKVIISICIMVSLMGVFVNVNASEDQEMITSNQVLEDGFLEETEEEEFLNFFFSCAKTSLDEYYDDLYFEKMRKRLTKKYREFWDALLNYTNWYEITNSRLFSSEVVTKEYALKQNMYLDDVVYYSMKDKINDVQFTFHTEPVLKISPV